MAILEVSRFTASPYLVQRLSKISMLKKDFLRILLLSKK